MSHINNASNDGSFAFPANPQQHVPPPASARSQYTYPDVSPLGSDFTDAAIPPEDERTTLWRSNYALGANMDSFVRNQHASAEATQGVLNALVDRLASTSSGAAGGRSAGAPKFRDPRMFNGRSDQVDPFLREIRNAIGLQRNVLLTERDKTRYFSLYLADGTPTAWYVTIERSPEKAYLLDDFEALVKAFTDHFDEPDRYAKALRNIRKLRQTGSAADYTARFLEYVSELNWTDEWKIQQYYEGLKESVQDTLINRKGRYFTQNFEEFYKLCVIIDNELHELALNRRAHASAPSKRPFAGNSSSSLPAAVPRAATSSSPDVVPMEVDAVRRGSITAEEKQRRRDLDLCLYCGQGNHRAKVCPNKSAQAKAKEAKKAAPASGKA
ncbi:hypothetical protein NMY22_g19315 [Coprinellus aureogranulatus]|nr:hypothetical protein NMY22_g19315 [Coprinellus aureogranulatus]